MSYDPGSSAEIFLMAKANSSEKPGCADPAGDRLESWKDISTHLKRDIRTLHRWERDEAMPVHRHLHTKRGTVYAYRSELDQWRANRQPRAQPASSAAQRVMLAVLPLENLSSPADDDHLAPGLTEDIITHLGRLYAKSIGIIARTSIVQYHRTRKPIAEIGRELGVEYVLEGTVRRSGDRVRITAQLILASDQTHVWAASYDRDLRDILSLQQEMAEAVAVRIGVTLAGSNHPVSASLTDPAAFEAYLKGRFHWYRLSPHHLEVALEYFDLALKREPRFAPAYEGIARAWLMRGDTGIVPASQARSKGKEAALKALELDPSLDSAHVTFGNYLFCHEWDWDGAAASFRQAIALNPSSAEAHFFYADLLISLGRSRDAEFEMRHACELDPLNFFFQCFDAWHLVYRQRYKEAVEKLTGIAASEPRFASAHLGLWGAFFRQGLYDEAMAAARAFFLALDDLEMVGMFTSGEGVRKYSLTMRRAADVLARRAASSSRHVPAVRIARLYAHGNDLERSLNWLERACDARESPLVHLDVGWDWEALRATTRFGAILRQIGFPVAPTSSPTASTPH